MKNSTRLIFLFGALTLLVMLILIFVIPFAANGQTEVVATHGPGFFSRIGSWVKANAVEMGFTIVGTLLGRMGVLKIIKAFAHKGAEISMELGEFFADGSTFLSAVDQSIADDGTIKQNSIAELIADGKSVIAKGKDVMISIKPNPALK